MVLVGFRGLELSEDDLIVQDIKSGSIGGVILFDRDVELNSEVRNIQSPEQVMILTQQLQSYSDIPLIISIDQEGGQVNRLKEKYGFPPCVSQQYLGYLNDSQLTSDHASIIARKLNEIGINLNHAPCLDLNTNPANPVIGAKERSFSGDPDLVTKHAELIIDQHHSSNIATTLKHFPGHGSSSADSHLGFVDVSETWNKNELIPFREIIAKGKADVVMTAHIFNSNLDEQYPATLSEKVISGLLRKELGWDGIVISDDMQMKAISEHYSLSESIELAINAGIDILVFGNNVSFDSIISQKVNKIINELLSEGKITESRIEESFNRIMSFKNKYLSI
jgi:beta-N-acetylhexosaminidase